MENTFGHGTKIYRDTVIRACVTGRDCVIADDAFMTGTTLGDYCIVERRCMVYNCTFDDYSYAGYNSVVKHTDIGKFCAISWNCSIGCPDHPCQRLTIHPFPFDAKYELTSSGGGWDYFPLRTLIGNDVWIGNSVTVKNGLNVGDGAVIGAGAVVTHDVGPYEIWAGVPARKIGMRFSDDIVAGLMAWRWWDYPVQVIAENIEAFRDDALTLEKIMKLRDKFDRETACLGAR